MDPIIETGVTFGWTFEKRARPPFEGGLEILPKPRQDVVVERVNWPRVLHAAVSRPYEIMQAAIRGDKIPPAPDLVDRQTFPGRHEPPNVAITVEKGSRGYYAMFAMQKVAFGSEYENLDFERPRPSPKFDMQFLLGDKRCKLRGCFVICMADQGDRYRVLISTDFFDDGTGRVRLVSSTSDDESNHGID